MTVLSNDVKSKDQLKNQLKRNFKMKDLELVESLLHCTKSRKFQEDSTWKIENIPYQDAVGSFLSGLDTSYAVSCVSRQAH